MLPNASLDDKYFVSSSAANAPTTNTPPVNISLDDKYFVSSSNQQPQQQLSQQEAQPQQRSPKYSTLERLMQVGRGMTNTPAGMHDLFKRYITAPLYKTNPEAYERYRNSDLTGTAQKFWNEKAGRDLSPQDKTGEWLETTGEFITPIPGLGGSGGLVSLGTKALAKGAIKEGVGHLAESIARNIARSSGAATAGVFADERFFKNKDSPFLNFIDKTLEEVVGAYLGEKAYGGTKSKILQAIAKTTGKHIKFTEEQLAKMAAQDAKKAKKAGLRAKKAELRAEAGNPNIIQRTVGRALSKTVNPRDDKAWLDLIQAAKEEGVELPFNVALGGGKVKNLLANNVFKSMFTSSLYNNILTNADKKMVDGLKNVLENTSPNQVLRGEASDAAKTFLSEEARGIKQASNELFDYAETLAKPEDKIKANNLIDTIKDMKKKMADSPSGDQKFILNRILDVADKWKLLPKEEINNLKTARIAGDEFAMHPKLMKALEKRLIQNSEIPLERAISQRKAWNADIGYEKDIPGIKNWLNGMIGSLEKDISTSTNKEYLSALDAAKSYFKQNMVDRVRTDMASSLLKGELPKEAFSYMSTPNKVKQLGIVLGDKPQAKEIMQSLKRAKANEIMYEKAIDGQSALITEGGHIKYGALASNLIKSNNVELLQELLPPESFKQLQRLAKISKGFYESGREVGTNTSVTGIASSDINKFNKIVDGIISGMMSVLGTVGAGTGHAVGGVASAVALPAAIKGFSRLLSKPKALNYAVALAKDAIKPKPDMGLQDKILYKIYKELEHRIKLTATSEGAKTAYASIISDVNQYERKKQD